MKAYLGYENGAVINGRRFSGEKITGGVLSPHEMDMTYLSDVAENGQDISAFARSKDLAIDVTMTNFVRAYKFENQTFAGDIVAPRRGVTSKSGRYKTRGKEALDIFVSDLASDKGKFNEIQFSAGQTSYYIEPHGLIGFVSDEELEEGGALQAATEMTILLKAAVALRQEIRVRNLADATSLSVTPANGDDWDTSNHVHSDIAIVRAYMKARLGFGPSHLLIGDHIADEVVANTNIKSDLSAAMSVADGRMFLEAMTGQDLARFRPWGLQPVLVDCMYNSAATSAFAPTLTRVWGDDGFAIRIDNEMRSMTWALQFEMLAETIIRWRSENPAGWYYKILYKRVAKEVTPEAICKIVDLT